MMLDSGASISLIREGTAKLLRESCSVSTTSVHVVSATGDPIPVLGRAIFAVRIGPITVDHPLVIVQSLITPVILGIDFMQAHGLVLDFTTTPVQVTSPRISNSNRSSDAQKVFQAVRKTRAIACTVQQSSDVSEETIEDCAIPIPDQTANRITQELVQVFSRFGLPAILHSDQGANFESTVLSQTLEAFGVHKTRTTSYHPQGDGMVERFNRTLLQMLRTYVHQQSEWEQHLPLVLFAYRSATHPSTGFSPFELMFGRLATLADFPRQSSFEPMSYQAELRNRLSEFRDLVDTHHTQAAHHQKLNYDRCTQSRTFTEGDPVWLSCPIAKKLEARWEGGWQITKVISSTTIEIKSTKGTKVVHSNRLRHRLQPDRSKNTQAEVVKVPWEPPTVSHETFLCDPPTSRYPQRDRRPPDRLQMPPN